MHPRPAVNPRLLALLGVVAVAALLPLAGAAAGPVLDDAKAPSHPGPAAAEHPRAGHAEGERPEADGAAPGAGARGAAEGDATASRPRDTAAGTGPLPLLETTARCGPELTSSDGIEAQTCVLAQGGDTWARTYYRNATGEAVKAVLSVMGPKGRTVQMHCEVSAGDEPGACDTPKGRTAGPAAHYMAVAEFASESGDALLLRSGSNSGGPQGS
ncbi:hypothetical protein RB200_10445 [Streptomyces sp. PmtG]